MNIELPYERIRITRRESGGRRVSGAHVWWAKKAAAGTPKQRELTGV